MDKHAVVKHVKEEKGAWLTRLVLIGLGALVAREFVRELPALRRYWNMEHM